MHGKAITVLEMDYPIVEFMVLCETPYNNGECVQTGNNYPQRKTLTVQMCNSFILLSLALYLTEVQEPYAVVVLLEKDLIVVDLTQSKYVLHIYSMYTHTFQQLSFFR